MKIPAFVLGIAILLPDACLSGELRAAKLLAPLHDQSAIDAVPGVPLPVGWARDTCSSPRPGCDPP